MGRIEIVFGSMFSGKTEEMLRRVRRGEIAGQKVMLFKPKVDIRHGNKIQTHDNRAIAETLVIGSPEEILTILTPDVLIVGIDETQFFDATLLPVLNQLVFNGLRVICAGLDMWATGQPVDIMGQIACIADEVTKLQAVCTGCGADAYISCHKDNEEKQIDIGGTEKYTALCRKCLLKHSLAR